MRKNPKLFKESILFVGDLSLIVLAEFLSVLIRFSGIDDVSYRYFYGACFVPAIYIASFYIFDLYNLDLKYSGTYFLTRLLTAVIFGTLFVTVLFYFFPGLKIGRGLWFLNSLFVSIFIFYWRTAFQKIFNHSLKPAFVAVIGSDNAVRMIKDVLETNSNYLLKYTLNYEMPAKGGKPETQEIENEHNKLISLAEQKLIDAVIVDLKHCDKGSSLFNILLNVKAQGVDIYDMPRFYEYVKKKLPVEYLAPEWIICTPFSGISQNLYAAHGKRLFDILLALAGIIVFAPIVLMIMAMIGCTSPGTIFFTQERVGLNGKIFKILKLRSMIHNAESPDQPVWAKKDDPRITKIGGFLRKTRLDELPQLWNVLKGDMSFIGPRPERPEFVEWLKKDIPFYTLRYLVTPGITGWAQVNYRYGDSKEGALEKLKYDLFYIKNMSFFMDFLIILKTIRVVILSEGGR
ncbi:MAG TPA: sugar transferase [Candidatus Omnitrophota bacterium]|nr:sugar transferase [Candidatus Omnitrophota bacterium]